MSFRFWTARWFARKAPATHAASAAAVDAIAAESSQAYLNPKIKDVVFVHIPKTAGTSMRNMLSAALPTATKLFEYGVDTASVIPAADRRGCFGGWNLHHYGVRQLHQRIRIRHSNA